MLSNLLALSSLKPRAGRRAPRFHCAEPKARDLQPGPPQCAPPLVSPDRFPAEVVSLELARSLCLRRLRTRRTSEGVPNKGCGGQNVQGIDLPCPTRRAQSRLCSGIRDFFREYARFWHDGSSRSRVGSRLDHWQPPGVLLRTLAMLAWQIDQRDAWFGTTSFSSFVALCGTGASSAMGAL
jgi:hypothetical protein